MRAVAERLGTGPASLYAHFAGKDELLAAMIDGLAGELPVPEPGLGPWQDQFKDVMRGMRRVLGAHRDIAGASLGTIPTGPNALTVINGLLGVMLDAGLPEKVIAYAIDIVPLYATATAYEESLERRGGTRSQKRSGSRRCGATGSRSRPDASRTSCAWQCPSPHRTPRTNASSSGSTRWSAGSRR